MKIIGEQLVYQLNDKNGDLWKCKEHGQKYTILSHYTTFEILKKILSDKVLKFNRIDKVNDGLESAQFGEDELSHLVYVSCFTYNNRESIPMWMIYGKNNQAICVTFELTTDNFAKSFIDGQGTITNPTDIDIALDTQKNPHKVNWYCHVEAKEVLYRFDAIANNPIRRPCEDLYCCNKEIYNLTVMGAIKREEWEYEKEARIVGYLMNTIFDIDIRYKHKEELEIPNIDYLLIPIKFDNLKRITITFNPWMGDDLKTDIKLFMKQLSDTELKGIEVRCQNSYLMNEVRK